MNGKLALRFSPLVAFYLVEWEEAEELLIRWRHPLHLSTDKHPEGQPYTRPYQRIACVMEDRGRVAATVILASTPNPSVCKAEGLHRYNVVDLARIGRSPDRRDKHCLRAVLRITDLPGGTCMADEPDPWPGVCTLDKHPSEVMHIAHDGEHNVLAMWGGYPKEATPCP